MKNRITFLDGIRGLMAINILLCHFVCVYFPSMYSITYNNLSGGAIFSYTPLSALVNGSVAVIYFFLLSGFLLSLSIFQKETWNIKKIVTKWFERYLRFLPMVAMVIIFTYLLMKLGLMHYLEILEKVKSIDFLSEYCNFEPTILNGLYNIFVKTFVKNCDYVGPFWTIKYEIWGFLLTALITSWLKGKKYRRLLYPVLAVMVALVDVCYISFVFGIFLADLYCNNKREETYFSKWYYNIINNKISLTIFGLVGLFFFTFPMTSRGIYKYFSPIPIINNIYRYIGAAMLLWVLLNCYKLQKWFDSKLLQWLGKISFVTYAFHWTLMLSFEAWIFDILYSRFSYTVSSWGSFIMTLPVVYLVSYIGYVFIEKPRYDIKIKKLFAKKVDLEAN